MIQISRRAGGLIVLCHLLIVWTQHVAAAESHEVLTALKVEYFPNPVGIDASHPRFSWQIASKERGTAQSAYEIRVTTDRQSLGEPAKVLWDSGKVQSDQSTQNAYEGPPLQSRTRYFWRVRVWNQEGVATDWSPIAFWEMGLLSASDWKADWIEPGTDSASHQPSMLRREFQIEGKVAQARIYATSHGLYELSLNGQKVGDAVLTPGWTSYAHRLQYQTYDVTEQLRAGANVVGAYLGDGWYRGTIGYSGKDGHYGKDVAMLVQLEIVYEDGHREILTSDANWTSSYGPILQSGIYQGEDYDARLEQTGWNGPGFDARRWTAVRPIAGDKTTLVAPQGPPVRRLVEIRPKKIFRTPAGDTVIDLGQNMVGWVRLRVQGKAGDTVTLRHAEVLDRDGNFYTENLRTANQTIHYTLKGMGHEVFEPHFTFQGFRYVAVSGYPGKLTDASITGIVVHSDMDHTSEFVTDNPLINQLQHNILWGQMGNFVDVPTDCPQRDERLGWTGDAQAFSPTAVFNMDVAGFFTKWLRDLAADQLPSGAVPFVVPDILTLDATPAEALVNDAGRPTTGAAGWSDAATVIPWNLYLAYGDKRVLQVQYDSMKRWVDYEQNRAGADEVWDADFQFGDWLDFFSAAKNTNYGSTSPDLIATAYFARSTGILAQTAKLLGREADAAKYARLLTKIVAAFNQKFVSADGTVGEGTQTAYVLALDFDLLPAQLRAAAAAKLAADVEARGHLTTGFLGTPRLLSVLTEFGYLKDAYLLLKREDFPSWLYPVKHGATTIWERWNGLKPDGSFENKQMNSFNHYAYGAVGKWMYEVMGGIRIDTNAPGYKHIVIEPQPGGGFRHVRVSHMTPYGLVSSEWVRADRQLSLSVTIPPNTTATVRIRGRSSDIAEGGKPLSVGRGVRSIRQEGDDSLVDLGAGHYELRYRIDPSSPL